MKILQGNCLEKIKEIEECSIDSIVTDPPYEIGFMGKEWDATGIAYNLELWRQCLRVLKHGGHLVAFSGSRTYHRMAVAIEDAGFEVRDQMMWVYGSGFPKSHNISKAIDKLYGAERKVIGKSKNGSGASPVKINNHQKGDTGIGMLDGSGKEFEITISETEQAKQWDGWGTALKPAHEPIVLARKPIEHGLSVAENVLKWGVGGINIDGCRVEYTGKTDPRTFGGKWKTDKLAKNIYEGGYSGIDQSVSSLGRFPSNFIHDGSKEVVSLFPENAGGGHWCNTKVTGYGKFGNGKSEYEGQGRKDGLGSAARFFYCPKASNKDRNDGCEELDEKRESDRVKDNGVGGNNPRNRTNKPKKNFHPTVKPTELMRYLCRLVTPPRGTILDPFMGSGSTGKASIFEGFNFVGIEINQEYIKIAESRIKDARIRKQSTLF